jgi:long-chain acyl-CoA synthetase
MSKPWFTHYDPGVPHTLDYPDTTLDQLLRHAAQQHGEQPALIFGSMAGPLLLDRRLSYGWLEEAVNRFAAGLQQLGVRAGDRVTLMLPNCPQFVIAAFATWRLGAIVVCCNPLYVDRELRHLLTDSGSHLIVALSNLYNRIEQARQGYDCRCILVNIKEYLPATLRLLFTLLREKREGYRPAIADESADQTHWFQDVLQMGSPASLPQSSDPHQVATLVYTGGTTGVPKAVQLTHANSIANATALNVWVKAKPAGEILVASMPFFHAYGLTVGLVAATLRANTMLLIPDPRQLRHVLTAIARHRATLYPGVPTMFIGINNYPDRDRYDLTSLRFVGSSGAPLPPEVQEQFERLTNCPMVEAYGLTEAGVAATFDPLGRPRPRTAGVPLPDTDVKIVDTDTGRQELPTGETGEIIVKGPQVMTGYWGRPEETAEALRIGPDGQPGWLYSGDTGFLDEDGYLHVLDRKKDMIIASGYNIYPAEVEAVLYEHPAVQETAVIGVPHPHRGETVKAFVVLKSDASVTAEELTDFCRTRMAAYKTPRQIEFREALPKSPVGKVLRRELRDTVGDEKPVLVAG